MVRTRNGWYKKENLAVAENRNNKRREAQYASSWHLAPQLDKQDALLEEEKSEGGKKSHCVAQKAALCLLTA